MSEWKEYKLEDVIDKFIDYRGKTPRKTTSGIPLVTAKIVKNGRLLEPNEFIAEEDYESWMTRGYPEINDIILTSEAPLGEVALVKNKRVALAQRIITLQTNKKLCNSVFLKYYFQSNDGQASLLSRASGSTVEGIKAAELKKLDISLPSLPEQTAIAEVLSSLDDKIDLLHRQNKTLEQLAESLFRQWFVEEAEESWEVETLGNLFDIRIGRTPPRKEQHWFSLKPSDIKWISIKDLGNGGVYIDTVSEYLTLNAVERFTIPIIPENTVILSFKLTVGRVAITTEKMLSNEAIAHFIVKPNSNFYSEFLYLFLKSFNFNSLGSTSSIAEAINSRMIKEIEISVPDENKLSLFRLNIEPLFQKIKSNTHQIRTLIQLRDTLLPRLMNGEIRLNQDFQDEQMKRIQKVENLHANP
jgi:type I restriction enzyme S subunit